MKETGDPSGKTSSTSWHPQPHHQSGPGVRCQAGSDIHRKPGHPTVPSQPGEECRMPSSREVPLSECGLQRRYLAPPQEVGEERTLAPTPHRLVSQTTPSCPHSPKARDWGPAPSWLPQPPQWPWSGDSEQSTAMPIQTQKPPLKDLSPQEGGADQPTSTESQCVSLFFSSKTPQLLHYHASVNKSRKMQ